MKIRVLFLAIVILFGIMLFSNNNDKDLPINEWDMMKEMNNTKANGDSLNCTVIGRALFDNCYDVFIKDTIAYSCDSLSLLIFNIKDPSNPIFLGYYDTANVNDGMIGIFVVNSFAYVADFIDQLRIINISNPAAPVETGFFNTSGYALDVFVMDSFAYVADANAGLRIINVSVPSNPVETGFYDTGESAMGVFVVDSFAYVADDYAGLRIINVSVPSNPVETGFYDTGGYAQAVFVLDSFAYVADDWAGLRIINVSVPSNPVETGFYDTGDEAYGVFVMDSFAYVANDDTGIRIINVSNPANPVEIGFYDTGSNAIGVFVIDSFAYVADADGGLYIIKFPMDGSGIKGNKSPNKVSINNYLIKYNNTTIDIYFGLKERGELILDIYDKMGRKLNTLNNSIVESGYTKISINKNDYPTGEYFIKGRMGDTEINTKIMIIK